MKPTSTRRRNRPASTPAGPGGSAHAFVQLNLRKIGPALDGSGGTERLAQPRSQYATDFDAIDTWVRGRESERTQVAYRREADRLLHWSILVRKKPLSSLTYADALSYVDFLKAPPADWIHDDPTAPRPLRESADWRPFKGPLQGATLAFAVTAARALFTFLLEEGHLRANAFRRITIPTERKVAPADTTRAFDGDEWAELTAYIAAMKASPELSESALARIRFLFAFLFGTGLRVQEIVQLTLNDIQVADNGAWLAIVVGKGRKVRKVVIPPSARSALERYLKARGLPVRHSHWDRSHLVLAPLRGREPMTTSHAWRILKKVARGAANRARRSNPGMAARLEASSTHWLRHTHATSALDEGASIQTVRDNLGHSSLLTTSMYVHATQDVRVAELGAAFPEHGGARRRTQVKLKSRRKK